MKSLLQEQNDSKYSYNYMHVTNTNRYAFAL